LDLRAAYPGYYGIEGANKQREGSLEPFPLTVFTAGNMPFGRDAPRSLVLDFNIIRRFVNQTNMIQYEIFI